MIIGKFTYDAESDSYLGEVTTLTFSRSNVHVSPVDRPSEKGPHYRIEAETHYGVVEFGAAWKRTSEKGQEFLSVSIDDPSLSGALNAALFLNEEGREASLVWNRPKMKAKASSLSKKAA